MNKIFNILVNTPATATGRRTQVQGQPRTGVDSGLLYLC